MFLGQNYEPRGLIRENGWNLMTVLDKFEVKRKVKKFSVE